LNLDEVDAYKEQAFANKQEELFEEKKKDWKTLQKERENGGGGKEVYCCRIDHGICSERWFPKW
jgi:hypothetical protein